MAFPATPLLVRVDLQIAGVWTDVTADTLARDGSSSITIHRGRADEASRADPSTCQLVLRNPTGKYSPRNPTSPYYGVLGRNTPLRVGIGVPPAGAGSVLVAPGTSHVAPSVNAEVAGQLFCIWVASQVGNYTIPGSFTAGTEQDGAVSTFGSGQKAVAAGATGTSTATFSASPSYAAALSLFVPGAAVSAPSSFNTITGGASMYVTRAVTAGDNLLAVIAWNSDPADRMTSTPRDLTAFAAAGWMLVADTGPSVGPRIQAYARRVLATTTETWTISGAGDGAGDTFVRIYDATGVTDYHPRFTGEVSEWPPKWDLSGADVWVPLHASGITRRLGHGAAPLRASLPRQVLTAPAIAAYWPMEDPAGSTSFASALPAGPPMRFLGAPTLAADTSFACSDALPTFTAAGATGTVPTYTPTTQMMIGALIAVPATGMTDQTLLLSATATGTIRTWTIKYLSAGGFRLQAYDSVGASLLDTTLTTWTTAVNGGRFFAYLRAVPVGADVQWALYYVPIVVGSDYPAAELQFASITTATVGRVTTVTVGKALDLTGAPTIGHVVVASDPLALFTTSVWQSLVAWNGEAAAERIRRLCTEEGIRHTGQRLATSAAMGPQRPGALLDILGECETADGGVLFEPRGFTGFAYRTLAAKYDQTAAVTLSYSGGNVSEPFEPVDDDQQVLNDVTCSRIDGSSARATLDVGALSTADPPAGVGRYDTSVELNVDTDDQLPDQASWRLHKGTWDEARYPNVRVDLAKNPSLVGAVAGMGLGDLVTVTGLPAWLPPGPADLLLEGYTETLGHPIDWDVTGNYTPAGPYRVAAADSGTYGRLDSLTSTLAADVTSTATSLSVAVAAGSALWTTAAGDVPFDIVVAGEQMTVTTITGAASPQTFTVTRSANGIVKAQSAGAQVRLARPVVVAL